MRLYEFCKQHNITVADAKKALEAAGYPIKNHMSAIHEKEIAILEKKFLKQPLSPKKTVPTKKEDKEKLEVVPPKKTEKQKVDQPISPPTPKQVSEVVTKVTTKASVTTKPSAQERVADKMSPSKQSIPMQQIQRAVVSQPIQPVKPKPITLRQMTVGELAQALDKPVSELILSLMKIGVIANKNQLVSENIVQQMAEHFEVEVVRKIKTAEAEAVLPQEIEGKQIERHPVVVVMGHVDHGKTTLLDYIRKTKVAAREKGGITQHLGAYEAVTPHGKIVFLDTPGHEAFVKIRQRGIKVADIAILVVAADDGVMPQTIEAINFAKKMNTTIVVAITKVDKVDKQRLEVIKRELAQHDLLPEEWGGSVICVPVSGITGEGIDHLLEMIILQSQMMDLKTSAEGMVRGYVLEAHLDKGRGPVATVLTRQGTLKVGDYFTSGATLGRVSSIIDSHGGRLKEALPTTPVQVSGFEELPQAGDAFAVVSKQEYLTVRSRGPVKEELPERARGQQEGNINLIIKADNKSSQEAIVDAIEKLSAKSKIGFTIVNASVGNISERDIELAHDTTSKVIGFNVKPELNAQILAQRRAVTISLYDIIYRLIESLQEDLKRATPVAMVRKKVAEAVVRAVFNIKNIGVIAGSFVKEGKCPKDAIVVGYRGNKKIGEGPIKSLQREKKAVKEVHAGFECGFLVEGMEDWQVDDRIECYIEVPKEQQS